MEFKYVIRQDEDAESPREWENLGTMACWHSRRELGDEQVNRHKVGAWLSDLMCDNDLERDTDQYDEFDNALRSNYLNAMQRAIAMLKEKLIILPLYIYDHSGVTMRTYPYGCPWDSGQVGWIYVSKDKVREEYGWKRITEKRQKQIEEYLRNEVSTYDQWLTGDVWWYAIEDEDGEVHDACGGFFGHDYCEEEAKIALKYMQDEHAKLNEFERAI